MSLRTEDDRRRPERRPQRSGPTAAPRRVLLVLVASSSRGGGSRGGGRCGLALLRALVLSVLRLLRALVLSVVRRARLLPRVPRLQSRGRLCFLRKWNNLRRYGERQAKRVAAVVDGHRRAPGGLVGVVGVRADRGAGHRAWSKRDASYGVTERNEAQGKPCRVCTSVAPSGFPERSTKRTN